MSIQDVLCVGRLGIIISYMLLVALSEMEASLSNVCHLAYVTFKLVYTAFV